ncbi:MAG: SOS response-associated peptidase [Bacteroidales bacterium]|nr:SOS response-associated peptidase [Bacteroidales bacterium]
MCGRFQLSVKGKQISERFDIEVHDEIHRPAPGQVSAAKGFNCAPFQWLPVILNTQPFRLSYLRWGLLPSWVSDPRTASKMINARAETLHEKRVFKTAFQQRRCLVPANGFYEWKNNIAHQPYRFFMRDESLFAFAGIWEQWSGDNGEPIHTFSIVTTAANRLMEPVHDRMPLILQRKDEKKWLFENDLDQIQSLLKPFPEELMDCYPVSSLVNKVSNDDERLIIKQPEQQGLF